MSDTQYQCEILTQTKPYKNYNMLKLSSESGVHEYVEGETPYYSIPQTLDRTADVNCLIQWKNEVNALINNNDNININEVNQSLTELKSKVNKYALAIADIENLQQTLRGYENTKLDYIDQEIKIEQELQKQLLDEFVKSARDRRVKMQDNFEMDIAKLNDDHETELNEKDNAHKNIIKQNEATFAHDKSLLVSEQDDALEQKNDKIRKLLAINADSQNVYNQQLGEKNEQLEAINVLNNQQDLKLQYASLENQANAKLYDILKDDNKELELISRNAHNILTGQNINNKINKDMELINQIQASNRESFTNILEDNQNNFLLGLGVFSIGLFIYKMNK